MTGTINVYYIWYGNWSGASGANAKTVLQNLVSSEGGSPYFNINTLYFNSAGKTVSNSIQYLGSTSDNYSQGTSLSDNSVYQIVNLAITNAQLPRDTNGVYFVLTSTDVNETSGFCSQYCGWHTNGGFQGSDIKYAFVGNANRCLSVCAAQGNSSPNGDPGVDGMASTIAHELEESATDPDLNAWYALSNGYENADLCAWTFGTASHSPNGSWMNMTLGAYQYLIQQNWVNDGGGYCSLSWTAPAPALTSITPATGASGTNVAVSLTGTNFVPGASISVSGSGVTATNINVTSSTNINVTLNIAAGAAAGAYSVSVTTAGGTTANVTFNVTAPPTLTSISPSTGAQGSSVPVTLTGANFVPGASVGISGVGVSIAAGSLTVVSSTQITATFNIASGAATGNRNVSVTASNGTSGNVTFTVTLGVPALTSISPATGVQGSNVAVTLTGASFASGATIGISGPGVTVAAGSLTVVSSTQITATFSITLGAATGNYNVTVTTAGGTSGSVTFTVGASGAPPTQGLVGYWNFDENSGNIAHDTSGNGYNGTVTGAAWVAGKINSALSFNGNTSYVVTPNIPLPNAFSISAWVNPAVTSPNVWGRIAETQYNGGLYLGTDATGTKYKLIVNTGAGSTGSCGSGFGCAEGGTISSGWHLVTGTFDGTTAKLYVDNAVLASDTFQAPSNTNLPLYIGRYYGSNGYGWNGALDEVRLYNRALTSAEVSTIFNYTGGPPPPPPPSVSITAPTNNATVSNTITVSATATDNLGIASVQFQLDGTNLGAALTVAPYSISWDTTTASNGAHTLTAMARDPLGNSGTSTAVTVTVSNGVVSPPTLGLVGYWNFDENSGNIAHDTSGNGYNGAVTGAAWVAGKINSALSFNGNTNSVVTPNILLANAFSISAWVNPAVTSPNVWGRIAETQYNGGLYLGTDATGTKYKLIVNTGAGSTGSCGSGFGCAEGGTISSGWHLVTGTFDGTTAKLYVDNAVLASDTFQAPSNTNLPLYIGRYYGSNGYGWNGALDEVRLYNRALTSAEVSAIFSYTGAAPGKLPRR